MYDIFIEYLQFGGRVVYCICVCIVVIVGFVYGVYVGYEFFENVVWFGFEENIDNEKYEYKFCDWKGVEECGEFLVLFLCRFNEIWGVYLVLGQLCNFCLYWSDDDVIFVYSKYFDVVFIGMGRVDIIIVVVNVDLYLVCEMMVYFDIIVWGVFFGDVFEVEDFFMGEVWMWCDYNYVWFDVFVELVYILKVRE